MFFRTFAFLLLASFMLISTVCAQENNSILKRGQDFHIIYDEDNKYQVNDAISAIDSYPFMSSDYIELNFATGTVWLATSIKDLTPSNQPLIFELQNSSSFAAEFFLIQAGKVIQHLDIKNSKPEFRHHSPSFAFKSSQEDITLLVKLSGVNSGTRPLIWTQAAFIDEQIWQLPLKGAFIGILLALALYNIINFFGIRHKAYIWYSSYILLTILWRSLFSGFGPIYIGEQLYSLLLPFTYSFVLAAIGFAGLFCADFINLRQYSKPLLKIINLLTSVSFILTIFALALPPSIAMIAISALTVIAGPTFLIAALTCWRKGEITARFYIFSWLPLVVAVAYIQLTIWQVIPTTEWRTHWLDLALLLEALLMSVALADKLRQNEKEKVFLATHDPLTRLPNRNLVYKELSNYKAFLNFTLLQIDLCRIDEIRNTIGLKAANRILCLLSERLCIWSQKQKNALTFEVDGSYGQKLAQLERGTLVIAFRGYNAELGELCDEIRELIQKPINYHSLSLSCDCHIGAVFSNLHGNTTEQLIQNLNISANLATQKQLTFVLYSDEKNLYTERRLAMMAALKRALSTPNELALYLQPQVDLQTNKIIGAEALIRWQHIEHGSISPKEFIPLAEESGLINELTSWVLKEALQINQVIDRACPGHQISVNISVQDLELSNFIQRLKSAFESTQLKPQQLLLEVTESAMISDPGQAHLVLEMVSEMGILTSIDDFGTGYSSLSYLSLLPVNELKIDKSFVVGIASKEQNYTITENIINLSNNLSLQAVAEGIEDKATFETLKDLGCDIGQGFYFSRPLALNDYLIWLNQWNQKHSLNHPININTG
ncbi:EAL domain-containing protein [Catenovulum sp. SM1970]|uniref:EAL domain-containing protein n=1 Tax=Marinifaba aquimaris TaxID=2741323 RepID=UPI0015739E89|nr:EAL domain-containing protein [Marinifaba aquimaris]NTS76547.1 EAL domain-containing protein [Marinifaba aquimaris]